MKKIIVTCVLAILTIVSTSAFMTLSQTGIAGATGAPGEISCNASGCHFGGSSAVSGISLTSVPSFTNNEFVPGTSYVLTVQLAAQGFNHYGFDCEILGATNGNAGTMQSPGAGVKFLNFGQKKDAVHTTPKAGTGGASFSFGWTAPATGDTATIYVAGNAVNFNGSTTGDFPIPPVFFQLNAQQPVDTTSLPVDAIKENKANYVSGLSVFPNPASGLTSISYTLLKTGIVTIELVDMSGKLIKEFINEAQTQGSHDHLLSLQNVATGVYFVKTSVDHQKVSQKLIAVR